MTAKKKVGVITFHNYDNYGAVLQSYALQKTIEGMGADAELIDYRCDYISNPFQLSRIKNKGLFNYVYGVIGYVCYLPRRRKFNLLRKKLRYSHSVNKKSIAEVDGMYDVYITGSDQVWDYSLTDFDKVYFLDFVTKGRKCSYAASIGEHLPDEKLAEEYARLLKDFDDIYMRESYGADVVEKLVGKRPGCTCDPTLLFNGEEWARLAADIPRAGKEYVLVYQLGINPDFVGFVKKLKKTTGLPVVYVPFPLVGLLSCKMKIGAGPEEWISFFRDAKYVVTDSFHGTVFSILFRKPFFVKTDGHHVNRRVQEFLTDLGLTDRIISDSITDEALTCGIEYDAIDEKLTKIRKDSIEKLKRMVSEEE